MRPGLRPTSLLICVLLLTGLYPAVTSASVTVAGTAAASALSSTWIAVESPFEGDDDRDGWTTYELGLAAAGPFDLGTLRIPGLPEWRVDVFRGLTPDTDYWVRVTYADPDGVTGDDVQIVGPARTQAAASDAVTLVGSSAEVRQSEIYVSVPIQDDANGNSYGTVEVATDPGGPWTEKCGSPTESRLPYHPKRCRLRSLEPSTDYWVRIDMTDPDGIVGTDPEILGPLTYDGLENLADGRPITADPGWGCCPNPAQLVDGRIQYRFWPYGFAWTGGTSGYGGGPAGWKQATIDLGAPTSFDRVAFWTHSTNSTPTDWRVETSDDGATWSIVFSTTDPMCRGASQQLQVGWGYPSCAQEARFPAVTARYVRYWFDDRTLFGGLHGWGVEIEVFGPDTDPPTDPTAIESTTHATGIWSTSNQITLEWSGADDTGGSGLAGYSVLFDQTPTTLPDETVDVPHQLDPNTTTSVSVADGGDHWFHLRTCDLADNCTSTVHLGPFAIDTTPPDDPASLVSTSHATGVWSSDNQIAVEWSGASDAGAGLAGYSVLFDTSPTTLPDDTVDVAQGSDPHSLIGAPLSDGANHWFHLRSCDLVGNCTTTLHLGPFWIDTTAPSDPTVVQSTSHTIGLWSNDNEVAMEWSGASDVGAGLAGYSVLFDTSPTTLPDDTVDVAQGGDPHSMTSPSLPDGSGHWFHLRSCDLVGNCTSTAHLGAFWIDVTDPVDPTGVSSTSHTPGTPSNVTTIEMTWSSGSDATSGVDGYAYEFSQTSTPSCDQGKDLEESEISVSSPSLVEGDWWFHICTVDNAGNWTSTVTVGPFVLDLSPPVVTDLDSSQRTVDGSLDPGESTAASITQLLVTFDEEMHDPPGDIEPDDVTNPENWLLIADGADDLFQTGACGPVQGDDLEIGIPAVSYDDTAVRATLRLDEDVSLVTDTYRLLACASTTLRDPAGNALDGDGDGTAGDDFTSDFRIAVTNHLANPNFDADLDSWILTTPSGSMIDHGSDDVGDIVTSGSARILNMTGPSESFTVGQCLVLEGSGALDLGASVRLTSGLPDAPVATAAADLFDSTDCSGSPVASAISSSVAGDTAGVWKPLDKTLDVPGTAQSALVVYVFEAGSSADFEAALDVPFLRDTILIFEDGFESGDTTAWSIQVP